MDDLRVIAVDWSGAAAGAERKIWLAEVREGALVRLECGRSRDEVARHLMETAERHPRMVAGLDFAFSMPRWFLEHESCASAPELWTRLAAGQAETWLRACKPPFWGRAGTTKPTSDIGLRRRCEEGLLAKPVFQIAGAGAVGTGSLRGMPVLAKLQAAGFRIWPFDAPGTPLVVEIYPRTFVPPRLRKTREDERRRFLQGARYDGISTEHRAAAVRSDDAFDAIVSAFGMWDARDDLLALPVIDNPQLMVEGIVWHPGWRHQLRMP